MRGGGINLAYGLSYYSIIYGIKHIPLDLACVLFEEAI